MLTSSAAASSRSSGRCCCWVLELAAVIQLMTDAVVECSSMVAHAAMVRCSTAERTLCVLTPVKLESAGRRKAGVTSFRGIVRRAITVSSAKLVLISALCCLATLSTPWCCVAASSSRSICGITASAGCAQYHVKAGSTIALTKNIGYILLRRVEHDLEGDGSQVRCIRQPNRTATAEREQQSLLT